MLMNNLSTTVKLLRKQYNLTQEELSLKSGVAITISTCSFTPYPSNTMDSSKISLPARAEVYHTSYQTGIPKT